MGFPNTTEVPVDLSDITSLQDFSSDAQRMDVLISAAGQRETAFAAITHIGRISIFQNDEMEIIRLLAVIAQRASWAEGELIAAIRIPRSIGAPRIGTCELMLLGQSGPMREVLSKFELRASFRAFQDIIKDLVANRSLELFPFKLQEMSDREIILAAPRVHSIAPQGRKNNPPPLPSRALRAPAVPVIVTGGELTHPQVRAPPREPPSRLGQMSLRRVAVPQTPEERPATVRPPIPSDEDGVQTSPASPGGYSSAKQHAVPPLPPSLASLPHDDDVDGGWE